jgi:hypothetical protein
MSIKRNDAGILTTDEVWWINAHTNPPDIGDKVRVLNQDGCDAGTTVWGRESIKYFDGWLPQARRPADIRAIQLARYQLDPKP